MCEIDPISVPTGGESRAREVSRSRRSLIRGLWNELTSRTLSQTFWVILLCGGLSCLGCALRPEVRRICLDIDASEKLNVYEGAAHSVSLFVYALSDPAGFEAAPTAELLVGHLPEGVIEPPVPFTIAPATQTRLERVLPASTQFVGVLADYHRPPNGPGVGSEEGDGLRAVVPARCGLFTPDLKLSEFRIEDE